MSRLNIQGGALAMLVLGVAYIPISGILGNDFVFWLGLAIASIGLVLIPLTSDESATEVPEDV